MLHIRKCSISISSSANFAR